MRPKCSSGSSFSNHEKILEAENLSPISAQGEINTIDPMRVVARLAFTSLPAGETLGKGRGGERAGVKAKGIMIVM